MEKAKAYIKSSLGGVKPASPSPSLEKPAAAAAPDDARVCFVCGGGGLGDQYSVRVKPDPQVLPMISHYLDEFHSRWGRKVLE